MLICPMGSRPKSNRGWSSVGGRRTRVLRAMAFIPMNLRKIIAEKFDVGGKCNNGFRKTNATDLHPLSLGERDRVRASQYLICGLLFLFPITTTLFFAQSAFADSDPAHEDIHAEKPLPWPNGRIPYDISNLSSAQQT